MIKDKTRSLMSNNGSHASLTYISSWAENYLSWFNNNQFRRLFIKYEDLISKPEDNFKLILEFISKITNTKLEVDKKISKTI